MAALICGSLAFDTIMTFEGRFAEQILPDQLHILNVSFLVPGLRRDFGGCAGNIAYSLKALGGTPLPMATLGNDGADYQARLNRLGISTEFVCEVSDSYTAQALIMTDRDNNQITAFHPGAMMQAHITEVPVREDIRLGIISPDGRDAMQGLVVTLGAQGCDVWEDGVKTWVPPIEPAAVVDPTGCGDAWRGALLYGLEAGWTLPACAALGNRIGALKIAQRGPQNYTVILND